MTNDDTNIEANEIVGDKLQKVLAQAGVGSRRQMEAWIAEGRVTVNGQPATLGMRVVEGDVLRADKRTVQVKSPEEQDYPRVLLYHKQEGEIVSRDDPEKRANVFDKLPKLRGQKWIAIGRLDYNTSGLLIFTTSGELANRLMHPKFEIEREYAVRIQGAMSAEQMQQMTGKGIELEDGWVKFAKLSDEGGEGFNHWYNLILKEGRNRVVRRTFEALGYTISRLMRVRFGIVNLPPRIKRGVMAELGSGEIDQILEWVGMPTSDTMYMPQVQPDKARAARGAAQRTAPLDANKRAAAAAKSAPPKAARTARVTRGVPRGKSGR
jgi:23S rRNA pseudouridine2605 synthase